MSEEDGKKIVDEKTIAREIFGEPGAHSGTNTCGGGRINYCVWCSGPLGYSGAHAYQICRDIYGREALIAGPKSYYEFCLHEEYKEEERSYTQPTSTYGARKRHFWELDYEAKKKVVWATLGMYLIAIAFILVFLPPVLVIYHFVSTALNPLWIGLFLAHLVGAIIYYFEVADGYCCERVDMGAAVITTYIIMSFFFFLLAVPLIYLGPIAG